MKGDEPTYIPNDTDREEEAVELRKEGARGKTLLERVRRVRNIMDQRKAGMVKAMRLALQAGAMIAM
jgi:hypothetical protein